MSTITDRLEIFAIFNINCFKKSTGTCLHRELIKIIDIPRTITKLQP